MMSFGKLATRRAIKSPRVEPPRYINVRSSPAVVPTSRPPPLPLADSSHCLSEEEEEEEVEEGEEEDETDSDSVIVLPICEPTENKTSPMCQSGPHVIYVIV